MIGRNDLTATIVTRPGERPRLRVLAGPGWVEGEHGQDLAEGLRQLTGAHMGDWAEVSRSPGAQVARCTKKACDWATRPIPHGRPTPTTCEACGAPAGLEAVAHAGEVILLEQASAPTRAQRLEREFRAAKPQRRVAAARAWAQACARSGGWVRTQRAACSPSSPTRRSARPRLRTSNSLFAVASSSLLLRVRPPSRSRRPSCLLRPRRPVGGLVASAARVLPDDR